MSLQLIGQPLWGTQGRRSKSIGDSGSRRTPRRCQGRRTIHSFAAPPKRAGNLASGGATSVMVPVALAVPTV